MKKVIVLACIVLSAVLFVACGGNENGAATADSTKVDTAKLAPATVDTNKVVVDTAKTNASTEAKKK